MNIILPDGQTKTIEPGQSGYDIALSISPGLAKKSLAYALDGQLYDLHWPIPQSGTFELITEKDSRALFMLRHDASHLLAQAITELFPGTRFGVGPAIDEGFYYDMDLPTPLSEEDFPKIEAVMHQLAKQAFPITRHEISKKEALTKFADDPYKIELIEKLEGTISIYTQGNFTDLCLGPHFPNTSYNQHFKLLTTAGAYWRGDSKNKQLTRIYGTAFFSKKDLEDHLHLLEERKKRDHRKLGKELGLFMMSDFGPGFPFWLDKGMQVRKTLENFWMSIHRQAGYQLVQTPTMLSKELWETSGHWYNYKENMYVSEVDDREFAIKPMNCPGSMLVYKNAFYSYKDLPIRMGELGNVHRHEASGALSGLFRVRNFTQDDAHIYCTPDQLAHEVQEIVRLFDFFYTQVFHLEYDVYLSTRPEEKYIGSIETWNASEKALGDALTAMGKTFTVNPGDGAFYGPKLDFKLKDSVGRTWQCGTVQLDMNNPERFDLTYINEKNEKVRPIMLHRVVYGSLERFIGILIEHYAGAFPTWLAPLQVRLLPVHLDHHATYTETVRSRLLAAGLRVDIDASNEKLGYRIRQAQMEKIPFSIVIGDKERDENLVTYRRYGEEKQVTIALDAFISLVQQEVDAIMQLKFNSLTSPDSVIS
jgi:threonyl-tRNA synthetase